MPDRSMLLAIWQEANAELRMRKLWFGLRCVLVVFALMKWWFPQYWGALSRGSDDEKWALLFVAPALLGYAFLELVLTSKGSGVAVRRDEAALELSLPGIPHPRFPWLRRFAWNPLAVIVVVLAVAFAIVGLVRAFNNGIWW